MLFYHTKHVIAQQERKAKSQVVNDDNDELGLDQEPVDSDISESESESSD